MVRAGVNPLLDASGYTVGANAYLDDSMTNPAAILETMSHEIGHPAGFGHCSCAVGESVMSLTNYDANDPASMNQARGRATTPTACDNANMKDNVYGPCSVHAQETCVAGGGTVDPSDPCVCQLNTGGGGGYNGGETGGGGYNPDYPSGGGGGCTSYYWVRYNSYDGGKTWHYQSEEYAGCW